jgi:hypothetical protein
VEEAAEEGWRAQDPGRRSPPPSPSTGERDCPGTPQVSRGSQPSASCCWRRPRRHNIGRARPKHMREMRRRTWTEKKIKNKGRFAYVYDHSRSMDLKGIT